MAPATSARHHLTRLIAGLFFLTVLSSACAEHNPEGSQSFETRQLAASPHYEGEPGAGVEFFNYGTQSSMAQPGTSPVLTDIVNHLPASYGNTYYDSDPITWGHETSHGIHAHLRNNFNDTGRRANAFYVPGDRAVIVEEPNIRKSAAARFIPQSLQGSRYGLYITGSASWDDTPLYIWDEWNAYVNGGEVGVDMVEQGLWNRDWRDGVAGQLEFTVYALALAMAVAEEDPAYFESNTRFKEFLAFNTRRAMEVYRKGAQMEAFAWDTQDNYYRTFENDPSAEPIRAFARDLFGEAWANHVLFDVPLPEDPEPDAVPQPDAPQPDPQPAPQPDGTPQPDAQPDNGDGQPGGEWTDEGEGEQGDGLGFVDQAPPASPEGCQSAPGQVPGAALWCMALFFVVRRLGGRTG